MKKYQFGIIYHINGDRTKTFSTGIDMLINEDASADDKFAELISLIATEHNGSPRYLNITGYVENKDIVIEQSTRLD